ncbi:uncharacterized protein LOC142513081 [Primulina tabacum]|uniref:uncharacterized protein LOC142513081 n=1 Tax=Primulina tabacum TaxID=48773 RepID=UPI003F59B04D
MANNTNFNDPLFLHPSDAPGMTIVSEQLTGVENYGVWSRAILIALRAKNKIAFIDGTCVRPPAGNAALNQWERCNALVLSWIMNSVSKDIFSGIVYSSDASAVWSDLKDQFDKVNAWKYIEHDQQHRLLQFLMGLNESYVHIRSQILMMMPLPTVNQAFSLLSQEESHRSLSSVDQPTSIFYAKQGRCDERGKDGLTCDHCGWNGHVKAHCFKLVGYPPGHRLHKPQQGKGNFQRFSRDFDKSKTRAVAHNVAGNITEPSPKTNTGVSSSFTPAQYAEILQLLGGATLHSSTIDAAKIQESSDTNAVNMAGQFYEGAPTDWIIDTGANEHMTGNYSLLRNAKSLCSSPSSVRLPNGSQLLVNAKGRQHSAP